MREKTSAFGKNNFDRLTAAGLIEGPGDAGNIKAKLETRIADLKVLSQKFEKIEGGLSLIYALNKVDRLKKLTQVLTAVKKLHASPLPVGSKKYVANCLNELTSLREGVYASNSTVDKKALMLIATASAKQEVMAMISAAENRMQKVLAESSDFRDTEELFRHAAEVINTNSKEAEKLDDIETKPFVIARVPVVAADSIINIDKLKRLGFKVDNLSGYAVIHNQLVVGISPKSVLGDKSGSSKSEKAASVIRDEAERLRKLLQKKLNTKLQFVSDKPYSFKKGTWFWLMNDSELGSLASTINGNHVKIQRWGFAFNK